MTSVIKPVDSKDDAFFWHAAAQRRLVARRCTQCAVLQHPPTPMCARCGSLDFTIETLSGVGTVHSWIRSRPPRDPDQPGRIVALIELKEGIRLVSNIIDVEHVHNGQAVTVDFVDYDGTVLPQFRPTDVAVMP